jgi:hypothetical protein
MPPSPIPAPLPPWSRTLLQLAPLIFAGLQEALQYIGTMHAADEATPDSWMHVQCIGQPVGSTERSDDFVTTFDIVNITGGAIDNTWTTGDFGYVDNELNVLLNNWATKMSADYKWREKRYYKRFFNPLTNSQPFAKTGAPVYIAPNNTVGGAVRRQCPQASMTSTDRTTYPRHWGRNYWPHPTPDLYGPGGYITNLEVDALTTWVHQTYTNLQAQQFYPVVPVTQVDKVATRGLLTVTEVQVDNLADVIRRRRPRIATYKNRASI